MLEVFRFTLLSPKVLVFLFLLRSCILQAICMENLTVERVDQLTYTYMHADSMQRHLSVLAMIDYLKAIVNNKSSASNAASNELEQVKSELQTAKAELTTTKLKDEESTKLCGQLREQHDELQKKCDKLQKQYTEIEQDLAVTKTQLEAAQRKDEESTELGAQLREQRDELQKKCDELQKQYTETEQDLAATKAQLEATQLKVKESTEFYAQLREQNDQLEKEHANLVQVHKEIKQQDDTIEQAAKVDPLFGLTLEVVKLSAGLQEFCAGVVDKIEELCFTYVKDDLDNKIKTFCSSLAPVSTSGKENSPLNPPNEQQGEMLPAFAAVDKQSPAEKTAQELCNHLLTHLAQLDFATYRCKSSLKFPTEWSSTKTIALSCKLYEIMRRISTDMLKICLVNAGVSSMDNNQFFGERGVQCLHPRINSGRPMLAKKDFHDCINVFIAALW